VHIAREELAMTTRHKILTGLAVLHLTMIACSAAGFVPDLTGPVQKVWRWCGSMTGGTNRYGFFKEVGSGCKVTCILTDKDGNTWQDELSRAGNREADMRANGSIYMILDFSDTLTLSWAAHMLARHPSAHQVLVQFEQYEPPPMHAFRDGARPEWRTTYAKFFVRNEEE
jgi:hypothetical protein